MVFQILYVYIDKGMSKENRSVLGSAPLKAPAYKTLGQGSFGYVLDPAVPNRIGATIETYPGNVTKVYRNEATYQNAMRTVEKITNIMGMDEGHRANAYQYPYTIQNLYSNLPKNIQAQYNKNIGTRRRNPTNRLYMTRLPNLGVDIINATRNKDIIKQIRNVPILTILQQVKKLVEQTLHMAQMQYIHADIRDRNVMINPTNGTMTIIDFDWLKPAEELYHAYPFGFYNNPPEMLFLNSDIFTINSPSCKDMIPTSFSANAIRSLKQFEHQYGSIEAYENHLLSRHRKGPLSDLEIKELKLIALYKRYIRYTSFFNGLSRGFDVIMVLRDCSEIDDFNMVMQEAGCDNYNFLMEQPVPEEKDRMFALFIDYVAPTFDNYGLGLTLLELFLILYPMCLTKPMLAGNPHENMAQFHANLRSRITRNGEAYTEQEISAIATALTETSTLLHLMSSFYIRDRPAPDTVVEMMSTILDAYIEETSKAAPPNASQGGKRNYKKTRHIRRYSKRHL